jgi:hypothetical protein
MSVLETILERLTALASGVQIGGAAAFVEVTQQLRPADAVKTRPACDLVVDVERQVGMTDGVPEYELTINVMIVQSGQPGVSAGKRIGDLVVALRRAILADPCLGGACQPVKIGEWNAMYPQTGNATERIGATADVSYRYREAI